MPFTSANKYQILRYLDLSFTDDNKTAVFDACTAVETESEDLVTQCTDLISLIEELEAKEHQAFVTQAGMIKADVIEWESKAICNQIREQRSQYKFRLAKLLNLYDLVEGEINAF